MAARDRTRDREAEAERAVPGRDEGLERAVAELGRNAGPVVRDAEDRVDAGAAKVDREVKPAGIAS